MSGEGSPLMAAAVPLLLLSLAGAAGAWLGIESARTATAHGAGGAQGAGGAAGTAAGAQGAAVTHVPPDARRPPLTVWDARKAGQSRPTTVVILVHGGAGPEIFTTKPGYRAYPEALLAQGYTVVMPHHWDMDGEPPDLVKAAIDWAGNQPGLVASHVGMVGFSAGGFVAACAAPDPRVAALVVFYGGATAACIGRADRMPPALILHGEKDTTVVPEKGRDLAKKIEALGARAEFVLYPGAEHGFGGKDRDDSVRRMVAFFGANVPNANAGPQGSP